MGVNIARGAKRSRCIWAATASALALTIAGAAIPQAAMAQAAPAGQVEFDIPAQDLNKALLAFTDRAGLQIFYDLDKVAGRRSSAVRGRYAPMVALSQLLVGTGLTFRATGNRVTLEPAPQSADGAVQLGPVRIEGEGSGTGGSGYVSLTSDPGATEGTGSYKGRVSNLATRFTLTPHETPQTSVTLTRQILEDFNLNSANDALQAAGIGVQRVETDRTYFTARGLDVNNFQIDGIGVPFSSEEQMGDIDTFFYDRVEILKGANGLTSLPGNPAATINFVRKRPTRDTQAKVAASYGSWDTRRIEADASGALDQAGDLRVRVLGAAEKGDSYLDRYSREKLLFSAMLEADLTDRHTIFLGHSQQRNRPKGIMWSALTLNYADGSAVPYRRSYNTAPDWAYWNTDDKQTFAELKSDWGAGWSSQLAFNYRDITSDAEMMMIGLRGEYPDPATGLGLSTYASKFDRAEKQIQADFFAKGPLTLFGREHELVIGGNWARTHAEWTSSDDAVALPTPPTGQFDGNFPRPDFASVTSWSDYTIYRRSAYVAGRFSLGDAVKAIAGVNLTNLSSNGERVGDQHVYDETKINPYLGITYNISKKYSIYASYNSIYNPNYLLDYSGGLLNPIDGYNIEAGFKAAWFDEALNASAALFHTRQNNTPEFAGWDADRGFSYYRPVDTKVDGAELTLAGQLAQGWQVNAGISHIFSLCDQNGDRARTFTPRTSAYLSTSYLVPQLSGLKIGGSLNWQTGIYRNQGTTANGMAIVSRQEGYVIANAMASYDVNQNINISFKINNLSNHKYLTSLYWAQSYYAPGRNGMVQISWKY